VIVAYVKVYGLEVMDLLMHLMEDTVARLERLVVLAVGRVAVVMAKPTLTNVQLEPTDHFLLPQINVSVRMDLCHTTTHSIKILANEMDLAIVAVYILLI
jgi:hypothetical protein